MANAYRRSGGSSRRIAWAERLEQRQLLSVNDLGAWQEGFGGQYHGGDMLAWQRTLVAQAAAALDGPGEIRGVKWNDLNGDGVFDEQEPGIADWTIYIDDNNNRELDEDEASTVTLADGSYSFTDLAEGQYVIREVAQESWRQTFPEFGGSLDDQLANLNASADAIAALVPNRFDFVDGETGSSIDDGGGDMFDGGNILSTDLSFAISYTNGAIVASDAAFGPGSRYFTSKTDGLFALSVEGMSIDSFFISGDNGADGGGTADGAALNTTVQGQPFSVFVKRVHSTSDPSINSIVIVPGEGAGVSHFFPGDTNDGLHQISGLSGIDQLHYLLVASDSGGFVSDAQILAIAEEYLQTLPPGGTIVSLGGGEIVENVNFGNQLNPGEIRGVKWHDLDRDGVRDPAEPTLAGWTIYLDENENGGVRRRRALRSDRRERTVCLSRRSCRRVLGRGGLAGWLAANCAKPTRDGRV